MENKKTLFVLLACALFAAVLGEVSTTPPSTSAAPLTSTSAPSTSTEAPAPTTLAPPPTTPPTPPTTPPTPPTTPPTPPPTTPAPPTPPTTAAPTPAPTPAPAEGRGNWTISDAANNVTCIIAQMILSAKVAYPLQTTNKTDTKTLSIPPSANASGSCDPSAQWIKLSWNEKNSIQVDFKKNDTTSMYFISKIDLTFVADSKTFPNISTEYADKSVQFLRMKEDFMIKVNQSFRCSREQDLPLPTNTSTIKVELALSSVQLQAFHKDNTAMFGAAQDCELDTPDIVPIAVGCALAALVCVVLVAYLIGRRRSQARGYLSM